MTTVKREEEVVEWRDGAWADILQKEEGSGVGGGGRR